MNFDGAGTQAPGAWGEYWRLTREASALMAGGPQEEALARFWKAVLTRLAGRQGVRLLDVACGNGAVTAAAYEAAGRGLEATGVDRAGSAITAYRARFPGARAAVADASRLPFRDAAFDVVASQFGVEYAGPPAFDEAARLVASGGLLAAVVHMAGGAIHGECLASREAVARVAACGILPAAKEVFRRGAAVARGQGSRAAFRDADARLAVAARQVEGVLAEFGPAVAGGAVHRLQADLAHMHRRLGAYDPAEVAAWADRMEREIEAYAGRMSAMVEAAVDASGLDEATSRCEARGLIALAREALHAGPGGGAPAAWIVLWERR